MGLKTAFSQARIVTLGVLAAAVWILLTILQVFERLGPLSSGGVGQTPIPGLVGLAVMGGVLVVMALLYSELGETEPSPDPWPPE